MRRRVVAAVEKLLVRFLLSVIREWLSGNLPPRQPATVGEGGQKDRVDRATLLKDVQRLRHPFVEERHGAHLDANCFSWHWLGSLSTLIEQHRTESNRGGSAGGGMKKLSPAHARRTVYWHR